MIGEGRRLTWYREKKNRRQGISQQQFIMSKSCLHNPPNMWKITNFNIFCWKLNNFRLHVFWPFVWCVFFAPCCQFFILSHPHFCPIKWSWCWHWLPCMLLCPFPKYPDTTTPNCFPWWTTSVADIAWRNMALVLLILWLFVLQLFPVCFYLTVMWIHHLDIHITIIKYSAIKDCPICYCYLPAYHQFVVCFLMMRSSIVSFISKRIIQENRPSPPIIKHSVRINR